MLRSWRNLKSERIALLVTSEQLPILDSLSLNIKLPVSYETTRTLR